MASLPRVMRWLLLLAYLNLCVGLWLQWFDGGFTGNWPFVLLSFTIMGVALGWEGTARFLKK
jgi:hypothetical protein